MKSSNVGSFLVLFIFSFLICAHSYCAENEKVNLVINSDSDYGQIPIAYNDTFIIAKGCVAEGLSGNVMSNDSIPENTTAKIAYVISPKLGTLTFGTNGKFFYLPQEDFIGEIKFSYRLCNTLHDSLFSDAHVYIYIKNDNDFDGIPDVTDIDDDNDGITDIDEGNGIIDSDGDKIPDSFDIDSDNDGIPDNFEWQEEQNYISPLVKDVNLNGWDDAYDSSVSGIYYYAVDTDKNGLPDFLDEDSDGDDIPDYIEGNDQNNDGITDLFKQLSDTDLDGLDDVFDTVDHCTKGINTIGSKVTLPDHNKNGIREWRDKKSAIIIVDPEDEDFLSVQDTIFSIYPNPGIDHLHIHIPFFSEEENYQLFIWGMDGKIEMTQDIRTSPYRLNLNNACSGIKIIAIQTPHKTYTEKISIQK